jgi:hypothetical protein
MYVGMWWVVEGQCKFLDEEEDDVVVYWYSIQ